MRNAFGVLLSVLLLQAGAAYALTADEVVARYVDARGGAQKLSALKSLRLTGKAVFGGGDFSIEARWAQLQKRPGMIRSLARTGRRFENGQVDFTKKVAGRGPGGVGRPDLGGGLGSGRCADRGLG